MFLGQPLESPEPQKSHEANIARARFGLPARQVIAVDGSREKDPGGAGGHDTLVDKGEQGHHVSIFTC